MSVNVDIKYNGASIASLSNQASVGINYDGETLATLSSAGTKTLLCDGKLMATDVQIGSKVLNCAGKIMGGNIEVIATDAAFYLIQNGTAKVAFSANNVPNSSSYAKRNPTVGTATNAITLNQPTKSSGNGYGGSYATSGTVNLTGYSKLTIEYDITTTGTVNDAIKTRVVLYAHRSSSLPAYQNQATFNSGKEYKARVTSTEQSITLNLSGTLSAMMVGIGVNNMNINIAGTVSVKNVYAHN